MKYVNYLSELLQRHRQEKHLTFLALEKRIAAANGATKPIVRRGKLKLLHDGKESIKLSITELDALQNYLVQKKVISLEKNMLFRSPTSILNALEGETDIDIFYAARYLESIRTEVSSNWDLQAIAELMRTSEIGNRTVSLHRAFHFGNDITNPNTLLKQIRKDPWCTAISGDRPLIAVGSPFSSYASEIALCRICGNIPPFTPRDDSATPPQPFYLYWPDHQKTSDSSFSISLEDLKKIDADTASRIGENDRALVVGNKIHIAHENGTSPNLLVARYIRGHLVMALIGIYAPATLAIAQTVAAGSITQTLPKDQNSAGSSENEQPVLLMSVIQTLISKPEQTKMDVHRDHRMLQEKDTALLGSYLWKKNGDQWKKTPA